MLNLAFYINFTELFCYLCREFCFVIVNRQNQMIGSDKYRLKYFKI